MDWCIDASTPGARRAVEADLAAYLGRRADQADTLADAVQRATAALAGLDPGHAYWVSLDWDGDAARLGIRRLAGRASLPGLALSPGATVCPEPEESLGPGAEFAGSCDLGITRPSEESLDPDPGTTELPADRDGFLTGLAAMATGLAGYSPEGCCATGGAAAARRAEADYRSAHGIEGPMSTAQVAEAFVAYQAAIGGDFIVREVSDGHAVFTNRTCPFGSGVTTAPHLCRVSSAMLGSMAARTAGEASVTLDERIATGDRRCQMTLRLGPEAHPDAAHRYRWPPEGAPLIDLSDQQGPSHGISLSLQLPRDRMSVPVIRHLARHALGEVGVLDDVIDDIELALAEACANVLEHSGAGDAYEVAISIRADHCELRIVDTGHGFDHETVREHQAGPDAERGRGLALMHALMDRVHLASEPRRGTLVTLTKKLTFDEDSPARTLLAAALRHDGRSQKE